MHKIFSKISIFALILGASILGTSVCYAAPTALNLTNTTLTAGTNITLSNGQINVTTGAFVRADSSQAIGNYVYTFAGKIGIGSTTPSKALSIGNYFSVDADNGNVVSGSIVPATATSTLGTAANPWKDLYVSSSTIIVGNLRLQDVNGSLNVTDKNNPNTTPVGITAGTQQVLSSSGLISTSSLPSGGSWKLNTDLNYIASGTLATLLYINKTNGRVGIGTITPDQPLTVSGNMRLSGAFYDSLSSAGSNGYILQTTGAGVKWVATSTLGVPVSGAGTAGQIAYYNVSGSLVAATSTIFISTAGNVGIGTTSPGFPLDIRSTVNGATALVRIDDGSSGGLWSGFRIDRASVEKWFIGMKNSDTILRFRRTSASDDMIIDTFGKVGIGTSTPWGQLSASSTSAYPTLAIAQNSTGPSAVFLGGNVGIGTTTPQAKLDVNGEIRIASTTALATCSSSIEGALRYNFGGKALEFCNGTVWGAMGAPVFTCGMSTVQYSGGPYDAAGTTLNQGGYYRTVQIGTQCWMKDNLNVGTMLASGSTMPINNVSIEKWCYNNDTNICKTDGGFYHWDEMMGYTTTAGVQGICPTGWHLPTDVEWKTLVESQGTAGCETSTGWQCDPAGTKLKSGGTSGFVGLLAGYRDPGGSFLPRGTDAFLWSSTESGSDAWSRYLRSNFTSVARYTYTKAFGFSARCVKD